MPELERNVTRGGSTLPDVIGACVRSWRAGDAQTRKNVKGWLALFSGGGLAVWIAVQAWSLGEEGIRRSWAVNDAQQAALVAALKEQTVEISKLVQAISADRNQQDRDHALILERIGRQERDRREPVRQRTIREDGQP